MEGVRGVIERLKTQSDMERTTGEDRSKRPPITREQRTAALLAAGAPKAFESVDPKKDFGLENALAPCLFICGPNRTGKSRLAAAAMWMRAEIAYRYDKHAERWVHVADMLQWYRVPRLLTAIRASWRDDSLPSAYQVVRRLDKARILVLDDLGAENITDSGVTTLYDIIGSAVDGGRGLIVTSNSTIEQIAKWDQRISSRLEEFVKITKREKYRGACNA